MCTTQYVIYFLHNRFVAGGTCGGDSGGPLITDFDDGVDIVAQQIGLLHGSLEECSNED